LSKQYKGGYDRQSVQSAAGKLSCNKQHWSTAPKQKKLLLLLLLFTRHSCTGRYCWGAY